MEKQIGEKNDLIAQDILGNPIDLYEVAEETMKLHRPVYLMSKKHPERLPVLGFIHEGQFYYGEDVMKQQEETRRKEEEKAELEQDLSACAQL